LLRGLLSSVSSSLTRPVCKTSVELNVKSELVRTREGVPLVGSMDFEAQLFVVRIGELVRRRAQTGRTTTLFVITPVGILMVF